MAEGVRSFCPRFFFKLYARLRSIWLYLIILVQVTIRPANSDFS